MDWCHHCCGGQAKLGYSLTMNHSHGNVVGHKKEMLGKENKDLKCRQIEKGGLDSSGYALWD